MNKVWKALVVSCVAVGAMFSAIAEASNLDTYRNLLMNKKYTIKYVNITPEERITNKDKITLTGNNTMSNGNVSKLMYKPLECIVVSDGSNRYEEVGYNGFIIAVCKMKMGLMYIQNIVKGKRLLFGVLRKILLLLTGLIILPILCRAMLLAVMI